MKLLRRTELTAMASMVPFDAILMELGDTWTPVEVIKIEPYYNDQWGDGNDVTLRAQDPTDHVFRERNPDLKVEHPLVLLARAVDG